MPYIPPEVVEKAREMDLLTYLKSYEPQELVHFGGNTYCTREHDSLKISNGKWCWFSRGIGGYSALDYLIKVKELPFMQAVETIMGNVAVSPPTYTPVSSKPKEKILLLPKANRCATHAVEYLHRRGIDYDLINFCISTGRIYESYPYHNVVFIGQDRDGKKVNAHYRKDGTMKGFEGISDEKAAEIDEAVKSDYSWITAPYAPYQLSNNNAEISRLKKRIESLERREETGFVGWKFEGGEAVADRQENRLQLLFEESQARNSAVNLKAGDFAGRPPIRRGRGS